MQAELLLVFNQSAAVRVREEAGNRTPGFLLS